LKNVFQDKIKPVLTGNRQRYEGVSFRPKPSDDNSPAIARFKQFRHFLSISESEMRQGFHDFKIFYPEVFAATKKLNSKLPRTTNSRMSKNQNSLPTENFSKIEKVNL